MCGPMAHYLRQSLTFCKAILIFGGKFTTISPPHQTFAIKFTEIYSRRHSAPLYFGLACSTQC